MLPVVLMVSLMAQRQVPRDSLRFHLYAQAELTWYGTGPSHDMKNRLVRAAAIKRLGFGGTRLPVEWPRVEPGRGHLDWTRVDSAVSELGEDTLSAYGVIAYSPSWAVPESLQKQSRIAAHRPVVDGSAAKGDTAFAAFAAAAARRYRGRIDRWEIWNEENHPAFWMDVVNGVNRGSDPADYGALYALARDSIKAANPAAEVAVGGLTSMNGLPTHPRDPLNEKRPLGAYTPQAFIRGMVAAGVRPEYIGLHPYSTAMPGVTVPQVGVVFPDIVIDSVFDAIKQAGLVHAKVWITEWGINVTAGMSQKDVDEWMVRALSDLLCRPEVPFVTIHALADANNVEHFGLVGNDGQDTMVGLALAHFRDRWRGCGRGGA